MFDVNNIRKDFPILSQKVRGKQLVYLDNAATTQKPQVVIDAINKYYSEQNSNIHRGVHFLSQQATTAYEDARKNIQQFINAPKSEQIIFTKGTTDGINLVAHSFGKAFVKPGDEIIISALEHHSNIVPWQMLCEDRGATLKVIPINQKGELLLEEFKKLLSPKTKLVAVNHISNTLGTINPIEDIIRLVREKVSPLRGDGRGAAILIDGAQAVAHTKVDVQKLDCDFYVFSGHKLFGPTGIGVLYGKEELLNAMPPYQGGGDMIKTVTFEKTEYNDLPHKFEAGTPNIVGGIGLGVAIDYVNRIGLENIAQQENALLHYATEQLKTIKGIRFIGEADKKTSVISFLVDGAHPFDVGTILDQLGIAVRTGHHCTQPLMDFYQIPGTVRASFSFYNTKEEVDILVEGLKKAKQMLT
ncbi:MAG: SufS family cysteine desulfurase [Bacteroidia bacterium]